MRSLEKGRINGRLKFTSNKCPPSHFELKWTLCQWLSGSPPPRPLPPLAGLKIARIYRLEVLASCQPKGGPNPLGHQAIKLARLIADRGAKLTPPCLGASRR